MKKLSKNINKLWEFFPLVNQKGVINSIPLILIAFIGIIGYLFITSNAPVKTKLFSTLYPKPASRAAVSETNGAYFSLLPSSAEATIDQEQPEAIMVRTDTHKANLFSAKLSFDSSKLEVARIDIDGSFITTWVERTFDNTSGKISIIGGVPKPGFSTSGTDVVMATIIFRVKAEGLSAITFDSSSAVYRNSDNVNFLVSATGAEITVQPAPSPSPSPSASPTESPSPSPSPTPLVCTLTDALWVSSQNPIDEGAIVTLVINGVGPCLGNQVSVEVREDDGLLGSDPVTNNPATATFNTNDTTSTSWVAQYQPDGFNGANDPPEYYFVASLSDGSSSVTSSSPNLEVNKSSSTEFKSGDANRDGIVDLQDLSVMFSYWFDISDYPDELDINTDGIINTFDFSGMLLILTQEGVISGDLQ